MTAQLVTAFVENMGLGEYKGFEIRGGKRRMLGYAKSQGVVRTLLDSKLCKGNVSSGHIQRAFQKGSVFVLQYYDIPRRVQHTMRTRHATTAKGGQIVKHEYDAAAFAICQIRDDGGLYVDAICSYDKRPGRMEHGGGKIIEILKSFARKRGLTYISLSALPRVLSYYPQFQFSHRRSCDVPPDFHFPNDVAARLRNGSLSRAKVLVDPKMREFMARLKLAGYGNKGDGFHMQWCVNPK